NVAAPTVLDSHTDAQGDAQVARLTGPRQPAELADLDVNHLHGAVGMAAQQYVHAVYNLVEDKGMTGAAAHGQALGVGLTRLLNRDVYIPNGPDDSHSVVHQPTGVSVGDEPITGLKLLGHSMDAVDVDVGIAAHLQLKAAIALGAIDGNARCHLLR